MPTGVEQKACHGTRRCTDPACRGHAGRGVASMLRCYGEVERVGDGPAHITNIVQLPIELADEPCPHCGGPTEVVGLHTDHPQLGPDKGLVWPVPTIRPGETPVVDVQLPDLTPEPTLDERVEELERGFAWLKSRVR